MLYWQSLRNKHDKDEGNNACVILWRLLFRDSSRTFFRSPLKSMKIKWGTVMTYHVYKKNLFWPNRSFKVSIYYS